MDKVTKLLASNPSTTAYVAGVAVLVLAPQIVAVPALGAIGFGAKGVAAGSCSPSVDFRVSALVGNRLGDELALLTYVPL
ncbi:hypothetical protein MYCTH_2293936 [Thermothelomyces thermophilus ATCC 42464]|uniref:Uncharacterized protein n=1 Tax=Thermothelomyces thermophilus (strain ATCC 42464 / BCRC 31852 / DSM 1799) TaxID=573729 RepID=G2Q6P1_THET4|nr:uncharacterized protein MYCTH_2293936 [Thermothelomyces thermophilus ATCC 42464]AEO53071.1 hypothetical protein MYCTH_2293936 [Thermothelomyces thermophilus ATCC 42464]